MCAHSQAALLRETSTALKQLLDTKQAFIDSLEKGESPSVPAQIPFTTFQKLVRALRCAAMLSSSATYGTIDAPLHRRARARAAN